MKFNARFPWSPGLAINNAEGFFEQVLATFLTAEKVECNVLRLFIHCVPYIFFLNRNDYFEKLSLLYEKLIIANTGTLLRY